MGAVRIGLVARADNGGLGSMSREFARHVRPEKVLIVQNGVFRIFPERYQDFQTRIVAANTTISQADIDWLLDGIDVVVSCETFYDFNIVRWAKRRGVKSALFTMCELFPERPEVHPDLYLCPSELDMDMMPQPKVYLPFPVATDKLKWQARTDCRHLIHTASHGGVALRKGTPLLIEAMKHVQSPVKLTIYSWKPFQVRDERIEVKVADFENYWQLWREGDALVYPQDVNGICLPVAEAFASGMGVITTDIYPFNRWLPKELMFETNGTYKRRFGSGLMEVDAAVIEPEAIARKIDEWFSRDLTELSLRGKKWAEENSWERWLSVYQEVFQNLCSE